MVTSSRCIGMATSGSVFSSPRSVAMVTSGSLLLLLSSVDLLPWLLVVYDIVLHGASLHN